MTMLKLTVRAVVACAWLVRLHTPMVMLLILPNSLSCMAVVGVKRTQAAQTAITMLKLTCCMRLCW